MVIPAKTVKSAKDLAINGAPPAFNEFLHVGRPNIGDKRKLMDRMEGVLNRRWLSNHGPLVEEFEERIKDHLGVKHCIPICNGTVALELAIRALELKDEVIIPSFTFIATAHALQWQGIRPVFADIDPTTHNLDPAAVERLMTPAPAASSGCMCGAVLVPRMPYSHWRTKTTSR